MLGELKPKGPKGLDTSLLILEWKLGRSEDSARIYLKKGDRTLALLQFCSVTDQIRQWCHVPSFDVGTRAHNLSGVPHSLEPPPF